MNTDLVLVIGVGFEPTTHSLEGCCSIQLSYPTPIPPTPCGCSAKNRCKGNTFILFRQKRIRFYSGNLADAAVKQKRRGAFRCEKRPAYGFACCGDADASLVPQLCRFILR